MPSPPAFPLPLQKWKGPPWPSGSSYRTGSDNPPAVPVIRNVQSMPQLVRLALLASFPAPDEPRSAHRPPGERATAGQLWCSPIHLIKQWRQTPVDIVSKPRHLSRHHLSTLANTTCLGRLDEVRPPGVR